MVPDTERRVAEPVSLGEEHKSAAPPPRRNRAQRRAQNKTLSRNDKMLLRQFKMMLKRNSNLMAKE